MGVKCRMFSVGAVLLGLIFGLASCVQTKYYVKSESALSRMDYERQPFNYIPLTDDDLQESSILNITYQLLSLKKYSQLKKYLSSINSTTPDYYLSKALYHISKSEYGEAEADLLLIDDNHYTAVKELLLIDLRYELMRQCGLVDYKNFLQYYQDFIDRYPDSESLKKVVALRIRYVRYGY